jgi:plasmid maintenance system antidote protein VapI
MGKTLAIIGTAGRQEDAKKLTKNHWRKMVAAAKRVVELEEITDLVSGGAAWADHVAVHLARNWQIPAEIWLPAKERDLQTAKYYHSKFSNVLGYDTWAEISSHKNLCLNGFGGFKERNTEVAQRANVFIAMTFGEGKKVKDGGTLDTVNKMQKRGINGYHLDLNALKLWKI